jgi:Peptidase family C25
MPKSFHYIAILLVFCHVLQAQNAVLSEGRCFKIGITQTSVYKIDASFLKKLGLNPSDINPKNLRLFGNGGAMLPQANSMARMADLTENAVFVKGEADGRFDENDALWFFGQSPHQTLFDGKNFGHQINHYSDTTFYFLQISNSPGLRIQNQASGNSELIINTFDDYIFHEKELTNRINSGREWWGEYLGAQTQQNIDFELPGLIANGALRLTAATIAAAQVATKFSLTVNGQAIGSQSMATVSTYRYDLKGQRTVQTYTSNLTLNGDKIRVGLSFDKNGQISAEGYLDFVGLQVQRNLQFYNQPTVFQSIQSLSQDSVRYVIAQSTDATQVWDISNGLRPKQQLLRRNGSDIGFGAAGRSLKKFIVFAENQLQSPASGQAIPNQNLRKSVTPHLLIVSAGQWQKQAQNLANFRKQNDGLEALVVTTQQVYNEFSSGQPDPTAIRDFAKYLYDNQPNQLQYLLLFGDASFDFKNNNQNVPKYQLATFVPTYESRESAHPVLSFSSDDYFGFLENNEGEWKEDYNDTHTLDIGVGRLPVKTLEEAQVVVNKLIRYGSKRTHGRWRQRVAFVADDGDGNLHQEDVEALSKQIMRQTTVYDLNKILVDAFPQIITPNTQRAPMANAAIDKAVNEGVLILNYTGHGSESVWADEQILTLQSIFNWRNLDNMPLMVTATCEFGRYENPAVVSGAELAVLSPRGGAIAMLTTARPVYANTNYLLNVAFYNAVFQPINNSMPRLGDVMRLTKNNSSSGVLNRNFTLLGDPSLRLNYPDYQVNISTTDTLKAGRLVTITGRIEQNNTLAKDFDGTAQVSVFDKENQLKTRGTENTPMFYTDYQTKLFEGQASIKSGLFKLQFVVPKNIDERLGFGRLQVYALRADSLADAAGANNRILVGGNESLLADNKPPILQTYLNDLSFTDGATVNDTPIFYAKINDENGLNLSQAGIGQDMVLTLNDTLSWIVNDYFVAEKDDYRKGTIRFPLPKLPVNTHRLSLKVWDTYNNSAQNTLNFSVVAQKQIIKKLLVYPNPLIDRVNFDAELFDDRQDVEATIEIYDLSGKILKSWHTTIYGADTTIDLGEWDGKDAARNLLPRGLYFYRLRLDLPQSQQFENLGGKLLIVR